MVCGIPTTQPEPEPEFVRATTIRVGKAEVPGFFVTSALFQKLDKAATATTSYARELEARQEQIARLEEALAAKKLEVAAVAKQRDEYFAAWVAAEHEVTKAAKCDLGLFAPVGWGGLGFLAGAATCIGVAWAVPSR